jgi:hypothetical protein
MPQRGDADIEATRLQRPDLLGDEGLGEARIALKDEQNGARHGTAKVSNLQGRQSGRRYERRWHAFRWPINGFGAAAERPGDT